jgi:hypothetical protein
MTETVEWGSGGIVKLLGFMGGLASYSVLPGYKVTDEDPARVEYDTTYTNTRTGNEVKLAAGPQLVDPSTYNVVEAGFGWSAYTSYYLIRVTGTTDPVTHSFTVVNLTVTFTR